MNGKIVKNHFSKKLVIEQWRMKLIKRRGGCLTNKVLVQGGRFYVNVFIASIVNNDGTILAVILL